MKKMNNVLEFKWVNAYPCITTNFSKKKNDSAIHKLLEAKQFNIEVQKGFCKQSILPSKYNCQ